MLGQSYFAELHKEKNRETRKDYKGKLSYSVVKFRESLRLFCDSLRIDFSQVA
jgi:hypothetical protein